MPVQAGSAYIGIVPRLGPDFQARVAADVEAAAAPAAARFGQAFSNAGAGLMDVGKKLSLFVTLPLLAAGVAGFKFASDLNESINKVDVVFGSSAGVILAWSKNAATALGMSRQEALEAAGTFGNLFTAMNIGLPTATDMSTKIVGLASDLASFNNANPADVLEALRAGLVGEAEPLRKFGINLSQARIEAKALELGLWDGVGPLDAGAKAQASYALILDDTTTAQGDFARTADGAANKQRTVTAQFKDMAAEIGNKLLPIGQKLLGWASDALTFFTNLPGPIQDVALALGGLAIVAGPLSTVLGGVAKGIGAIITGFAAPATGGGFLATILGPVGAVALAVAALVAGAIALGIYWDEVWKFVAENPYVLAVLAPLGAILLPIIALVGAIKWLADNWDEVWAGIQEVAAQFVAWVNENLGPVWDKFLIALDVVAARVDDVFTGIGIVVDAVLKVIQTLWDEFGAELIAVAEAIWSYVGGAFDAGIEVIKGILDVFIGIFTLDWDTFWNGLTTIVGGVFDAIVNTINLGISYIGIALGVIWEVITYPFRAAWDAVGGIFTDAWNSLTGLVNTIVTGVGSGFARIPGAILGALGAVANAAVSIGSAIVNGIVNTLNGALGVAGDIGSAILGVLKRAWNAALQAANDAIPNSIDLPDPIPDLDLPANPFNFAKLHQGGLVPGAFGQDVMLIAKAGERVVSARATGSPGGGAGSLIGDVTIYAQDARGAADELEWLAYTTPAR